MIRLTAMCILLLLASTLIITCDPDAENTPPISGGITGDMGKHCDLESCAKDFCTKDNHGDCVSELCVGQPGETYCTSWCDFPGDCPEGYRCTIKCNSSLAKHYFCVNQNDYEYLISKKICS